MKRFLSLILTLAMVLSLMAGICVGVSAEEYTMIDEAVITGTEIPELAVGDTLPALSYSVPDGANYAVSAFWMKNGSDVAAGTAVEEGNAYALQINVEANDGYAFSYDGCPLLINGEEYDFLAVDGLGENGFAECQLTKDYSFQQPIEKVEAFYDIPELGKALGEITIPDGVNYTLTPEWWDYNAENYVPADTVVVKGGNYAAQIRLFPVVGYEFTEDTEVWINGELLEDPDIDFDIIMYWSDSYNFGEPVSAVSITYTEPVLGQTLPAPTVTGENCVLEYYDWYDSTADEYAAADAVVELGHEYYLCVAVEPAPGYQFTDETEVLVNGAAQEDVDRYESNIYYYSEVFDFRTEVTEVQLTMAEPEVGKDLPEVKIPEAADYELMYTWYDVYTWEEVQGKVEDGGKYEVSISVIPKATSRLAEEVTVIYNGQQMDQDDYNQDESEIYFYKNFSFAEQISKFQIGYETPQLGKEPSAITIPDGVHYALSEDSGWYDYTTGELMEGVFEDGKRYELFVKLELEFGYETADKIQVLVNGVQSEDYGDGDIEVYIYEEHTFAKPIAKVELPAWPALSVGDALPQISGTGEHYSYEVSWYGVDGDYNEVECDTVEDGVVYYATIEAVPDTGYEFVEETVITLGGKALSYQGRWNHGYIEDYKVYSFGDLKVIEKADITTDIPGYGEIGGEVKIPENAGFQMIEALWGVATEDDYDDAEVATKAYTYGDHVLLEVELEAEEGHIFAPEFALTINGKSYEPVEVDSYEGRFMAVYDLGEIAKPAATPETGDNTPVALLSVMCLVSLAGMSLLLSKKRVTG